MSDGYLDKVYSVSGADATRQIYDDWAKTYEAEVAENGYVTPSRCAKALRQFTSDPTTPVLDFGCGTGLSGLALRAEGFTTVDGCDLSDGMLAEARAKNAYRRLTMIDADAPIPLGYRAIAAIGVIGAGAAPASVIDRIAGALPRGGLLVFSFNSHTLEDPSFTDRVETLLQSGTMHERFREHGPHLPARNITSTVYVFEKA